MVDCQSHSWRLWKTSWCRIGWSRCDAGWSWCDSQRWGRGFCVKSCFISQREVVGANGCEQGWHQIAWRSQGQSEQAVPWFQNSIDSCQRVQDGRLALAGSSCDAGIPQSSTQWSRGFSNLSPYMEQSQWSKSTQHDLSWSSHFV